MSSYTSNLRGRLQRYSSDYYPATVSSYTSNLRGRLQRYSSDYYHKLSQAAMTVANFAALYGGEIALDDSLAGYIQSQYGSSLEDAVHQLVDSRVFSRTGDRLRAVADFTILAEDEQGYGYASYEQERFARWREHSTLDLTIINIVRVG